MFVVRPEEGKSHPLVLTGHPISARAKSRLEKWRD
jgi:hypothetical protein